MATNELQKLLRPTVVGFSREHLEALMLIVGRLGGRVTLPVAERLADKELQELDQGWFKPQGLKITRMYSDWIGNEPDRLLIVRAEEDVTWVR